MKHLSSNETAQYLQQHDNYRILTHRRPDGDTIGSAAALCLGLRAMGKRAWVFDNEQFTPKFRPYLEGLTAPALAENDTVVSVDTASENLFPYNLPACAVALAIDHHGSNSGFAGCGYVKPEAAACGEMILELLEQCGVQVTKAMAEAIYLAVSTDTGCFRFANTTADTLLCAARCRRYGADTFSINQVMFLTKRLARLKLESHLVQTMEFFRGGAVCLCSISGQTAQALALTEDDMDDIAGFPREIEGVRIGVMLREVENGNGKISVRTAPGVDACAICALLGGGGHAAAAGATVPGGIAGAKAAVLQAIGSVLGQAQ